MDLINASLLTKKAIKRKVENIAKAETDVQVALFRDTLGHLERYLDTSDLRMLKPKSLEFILADILQIIDYLRKLESKLDVGTYGSVDGLLRNLRQARAHLQVARGMFDESDALKETRSRQFFEEMEHTREKMEAGLRAFQPAGSKR